MDEHRLGLKPILRRVWARKGQRPRAIVRPRYTWCYLYGFVHPRTGRTLWWLLPTVRIDVFSLALAELAAELGLDAEHRVVLVLDQAGWHASAKVVVPEGLDLVFLPPYSPELQPAERLWSLSDAVLVNRCFEDLDELIEVQAEQCRALTRQPDRVVGRTAYHWWVEDVA